MYVYYADSISMYNDMYYDNSRCMCYEYTTAMTIDQCSIDYKTSSKIDFLTMFGNVYYNSPIQNNQPKSMEPPTLSWKTKIELK